MPSDVDADFLALPLRRLADAALQRARDFGVEHADFRFERLRSQSLRLRDGTLQGAHDGVDVGFAVRVILNGTWGFASTVELTPEAAVRTAEEAVRVAQVSAAISSERIELADEPVYSDVTWVSGYDIDPLSVPVADKVELLGAWSRELMTADSVQHVSAAVSQVVENKFYADLAGTTTTQQRVASTRSSRRTAPTRPVAGSTRCAPIAPPVGRGWEYLVDGLRLGYRAGGHPDLPRGEAARALGGGRRLRPGGRPQQPVADDHESIGHATELDRALGYEANYAGHLVRHLRPARHARLRLACPERHRRPHRRARAVHHRL
jgi:TldD protein